MHSQHHGIIVYGAHIVKTVCRACTFGARLGKCRKIRMLQTCLFLCGVDHSQNGTRSPFWIQLLLSPGSPPPKAAFKRGRQDVYPCGSGLVRGDQGTSGSLGAPLPRVLFQQESMEHAPKPSVHSDALSRSGTSCNATCDLLGLSRRISYDTPRTPLRVRSWARGSCLTDRATDSPGSLVVQHPCPAPRAGAPGTHKPPPQPAHRRTAASWTRIKLCHSA